MDTAVDTASDYGRVAGDARARVDGDRPRVATRGAVRTGTVDHRPAADVRTGEGTRTPPPFGAAPVAFR